MSRALVYGFSILMVGLVVSPVFRDPPADSFPLSDYPMFSAGRPTPELVLHQALGVLPSGERVPLPPSISADNQEVLQSLATIGRAIEAGPELLARFCGDVAGRVRAAHGDTYGAMSEVEVVTSRFDSVRYFTERPEPLDRFVHIRCAVGR